LSVSLSVNNPVFTLINIVENIASSGSKLVILFIICKKAPFLGLFYSAGLFID
jgi:hypothetical protein